MYLPFRLLTTTAAVLLFDQAVFAGQFLSGTIGALHTHRENATVAGLAVLAASGAAVLIRWPGGGPLWPALACLGLFTLIALQIALGFARMLMLHIPLGVAIIGLAAGLTRWAWRPHPSHRTCPSAGHPESADTVCPDPAETVVPEPAPASQPAS